MEEAQPFFAHPPDLALLDILRRRVRDGEVPHWIHADNVYGADPVVLTARHTPATAADGEPAWYFFCTPQKKNENDSRIRRMAGSGTWKGERGKPLQSLTAGVHEKIGWRRTFSYIIKARGKKAAPTRLGWIMIELKLADDDTGICLCKINRSPRPCDDQLARALNLSLAPPPQATLPASPSTASPSSSASLAPLRHMDTSGISRSTLAAALAPGTTTSPVLPASPSTASPSSSASLGPLRQMGTSGISRSSLAAALALDTTTAPVSLGVSPMDAPATSIHLMTSGLAPVSVVPSPAATSSHIPRASTQSSPPKRWVQVQISDSPTKSGDMSSAKRVYGMIIPEEVGSASLSTKRPRTVFCKGWLTIEPVRGAENRVA